MEQYNLEFCFKGSRNYVQGPDIFDAVVLKLQTIFNIDKITNIKYSAHNMLYKNAHMVITTIFNKDNYSEICSVITFKYDSKKYYVIAEENNIEIECSNQYSEDIVRTQSKIEKEKIYFQNIMEDSLTEIIVSMNKYFLQETVTKEGKWIVTKFEYESLKKSDTIKDKLISLELVSNFNNKLTKSKIFIENKSIGFIYFSLV